MIRQSTVLYILGAALRPVNLDISAVLHTVGRFMFPAPFLQLMEHSTTYLRSLKFDLDQDEGNSFLYSSDGLPYPANKTRLDGAFDVYILGACIHSRRLKSLYLRV